MVAESAAPGQGMKGGPCRGLVHGVQNVLAGSTAEPARPPDDDDPDGYYPPPTEGPAGRDPSGECKYTMSDNPSVRVAAGSTFKWEWFSIGVILDRCHFFAVKRMRYVSWLEEGTVSESGHVSFADGKNGDDMRRTTDYPQPGGTKTGGVV